jgi:PPP family 3-phenylpropionic acid transporter
MSDRSPIRQAGALYFFYYAATAALFPFLVLHYEALGMSGRQIGLLVGLPPGLILVGAALWGAAADATQRHRLILVLAIAATMGSVAALSAAQAYGLLIVVVACLALCQAPIMPLVDSSVMEMLGDGRQRYGRIRLWGAVGWGVSGSVAGNLVERFGLPWSFGLFLVLMGGCLLLSLRLPVAHARISGTFWSGLRSLLGNRPWRLFLILSFVSGAGLSVVHHYLFLYLEGIGTSRSLMGYALTIGTVSEMLVFFYSDRLLERWGRRRLLVVSVLAGALRVLAYSWIDTPGPALAVQLLHGPSFAMLWVAGVSYAHVLAPPGLGATAQGQFLGVNFGLGGATGALAGGFVYDSLGLALMYRWAAVWLLAGLAVYIVASRRVDEGRDGEAAVSPG